MIKKLLRRHLRKHRLEAVPADSLPTLANALRRLQARNIPITTIIDVGASNGCWSEKIIAIYPRADVLCIEAQAAHQPALERFQALHPRARVVISAAGNKPGEIYFDGGDLFGGQASSTPFAKNNVVVPVTTIDAEVARNQLRGPFLVKLDTHGYEVPILEGAERTLAQTDLLMIEVYNFKIGDQALLFFELCAWLGKKGFGCLDLYDLMHRPSDNAFWQMDILFARADRPEFQSSSYR
jgi:FkbM family methyltransferase